jgi:hypothetical protein
MQRPQTSAAAHDGASASGYRCTAVLGLAVTSEWYCAGFEDLVDDERWQAITKPHTFVENWADPEHAVWKELPQSPCAERWSDPAIARASARASELVAVGPRSRSRPATISKKAGLISRKRAAPPSQGSSPSTTALRKRAIRSKRASRAVVSGAVC